MVTAATASHATEDAPPRGATLDVIGVEHSFELEGQPLPVLQGIN
jgi:hypothetical protein